MNEASEVKAAVKPDEARMKGRMRLTGSATVEAAFVVPIVIAAIFGIIIFCFFMCDRIKLESDISLVCEHEIERYRRIESLDKAEIGDYLFKLISKGYILCVPTSEVEISGDARVEITAKLHLRKTGIALIDNMVSSMQLCTVQRTLRLRNKEETARVIKTGVDIVKRGGNDAD